jgi:hypothetical protein
LLFASDGDIMKQMLVSKYRGHRFVKNLTLGLAALVLGLSLASWFAPKPAYAQNACTDTAHPLDRDEYKEQCGCATNDPAQCGLTAYVQLIINILSAAVGVVIAIMVVVGGIQYSMAHDNAQEVEAAKTRIRNAIIALLGFIFTYAFLQYVVPGGIF